MVFLFATTPGRGQESLQNMIFTAGTVTRDGNGRDWAYILWQTTEPASVRGKTLALYAKAGDVSSAAPYARKAIVALHNDPLVIATLLNRATNLGDNLTELDSSMSALFQSILPSGLLTPAEKLSAIIRGSVGDPEHENNLQLLARFHPGVAMALGMAHAEPIAAGLTTFELRIFEAARGQDSGVVGRVTVEAGHPIVLPAPDQPVAVPEVDDKGNNQKPESAKGELNVKLRWATTDALRRLSLLNFGFNVYRITRTFAESPANNFHITPPSTSTLLALAGSNPNVHRVNQAPVLKTRDFDPGSGPGGVADFITGLRDITTYFIADDNDRFQPGGRPFADGEQFYYFVTARDVLGRDGLVSPGTNVTICKRMPPLAPKGLGVVNDYDYQGSAGRQALMLVWPQNPSAAADPTTEYWVYRWTSISNMHANDGNVLANRIAVVPHIMGLERQTNLDYGLLGSPTLPADAGRTFWYSVRAVNMAACGPIASGNSAPAYGVLRDREGPGAPTGSIEFTCVKPAARYLGSTGESSNDPLDGSRFYYRVECLRTASEVAWAEVYAILANGSNYIGRKAFLGGELKVAFSVDYPRPTSDSPRFFCRVALNDGQISDYAMSTEVSPPVSGIRVVLFAGDAVVSPAQISNNPFVGNDPCVRHTPIPPGGGGTLAPGPCLNVNLHPKTKVWKVYRRIDDGQPTLIKTGTNGPSLSFNFCDDTHPVNLADACYYVQAFDENGNASPMALLGCLQVAGTAPLPVPVLSPIIQASNDPSVTVRWFCTPHAVERFEVGISAWNGGQFVPLPANLSTQLSIVSNFITMPLVIKGATNSYDIDLRTTPKVGPAFTTGPVFSVSMPIDKNVQYTFFVRALSADGAPGTNSNIQQFKWSPSRFDQPEVPWPARDLPSITSSFHADIRATQLREAFDGLAVRIGRVRADITSQEATNRPIRVPGHTENPLKWIFTNAPSGQAVLPVALYRCQVPNTAYPNVSGDVTQVSPLMEEIAYTTSGGAVFVHDPFIRLWRAPNLPLDYDVFLIDTQPVVIGARYKYLLVRFKGNREIDQVITTNEVEVQP